MKRFLLAVALACVLSGSAFAGDAHTVGAPDPAPVPGQTETPPAPTNPNPDPGDMGNGGLALMILDLLF